MYHEMVEIGRDFAIGLTDLFLQLTLGTASGYLGKISDEYENAKLERSQQFDTRNNLLLRSLFVKHNIHLVMAVKQCHICIMCMSKTLWCGVLVFIHFKTQLIQSESQILL